MNHRIATVGHVDHGKSTLIGRLLSDTEQTRDDRREKVKTYCEKEGRKFEFAFLLDALEEEQSQGITIDVTEVPWKYKGRNYTFIDTPGHREFIKKMVGGASQVETVLLMLDVTEGITETFKRQIKVLTLLGIKNLVVLINKMDLVDWSESAYLSRQKEINELFKGSTQNLINIPIAAWHGANLLSHALQMPWYKGLTLGEALEEISKISALASEAVPLRFEIQDVYRQDEKRIYVGRVESGELQVGDAIVFYPGHLETKIKSIEVYNRDITRAVTGDAVGLTLSDPLFLDRGALGFNAIEKPLRSYAAVADIFWLSESSLKVGDQLTIKSGTRKVQAVVAEITAQFDPTSFEQVNSNTEIRQFGRVSFQFKEAFSFDPFERVQATGRFVACRENVTLGGGRWISAGAESRSAQPGHTLWLTGLSGAGKSSLSTELKKRLENFGRKIVLLDGDELRKGLCRDLGFTAEDRTENVRRVAELAKLFNQENYLSVVALISPLNEQRKMAKEIIGDSHYTEVFVDAPLELCAERDVKGLYAKAKAGEIAQFTGVSAHYEKPTAPDLHLDTAVQNLDESLELLLKHLTNKRIL